MTQYRIGKRPNIRSPNNRESWALVEEFLGSGHATRESLIGICKNHDHKDGGRGFIDYCIKNEWLVEAGKQGNQSTQSKPTKIAKAKTQLSSKVADTGVYMAYPTSKVLKPIYRGLKTRVNSSHTKVGITTDSFATRGAEYFKTFDGEIEFIPLAQVPAESLAELEGHIVSALSLRFNKVGSAREWFDTSDRELVSKIVLDVIRQFRS